MVARTNEDANADVSTGEPKAPVRPSPLRVAPEPTPEEPSSLSPFVAELSALPRSRPSGDEALGPDVIELSSDVVFADDRAFGDEPSSRASSSVLALPVSTVSAPKETTTKKPVLHKQDLSTEELSIAHPQVISTKVGVWVATTALVVGGLLATVCFLPSTRASHTPAIAAAPSAIDSVAALRAAIPPPPPSTTVVAPFVAVTEEPAAPPVVETKPQGAPHAPVATKSVAASQHAPTTASSSAARIAPKKTSQPAAKKAPATSPPAMTAKKTSSTSKGFAFGGAGSAKAKSASAK